MVHKSSEGLFFGLSDDLLEFIFSRERQLAAATPPAAAASGAALPFVCRRWRRVYNTSQLIHGTFNLNLQQIEAQLGGRPGDLAALLRLLGQRGQAGRRLWLQNEGNILSMEAVLNLVSPRLQAAYLGSGAPTDSLAHLSRFTALRSLDLPAAAYPTDGCQLAMFSQLEELTLREGVSPRLLSGLAGLLRLRMLSLTLSEALPPACHALLGLLRQLEELHIYLTPSQPTQFEFQPGALAELSRLRSVLLIAPSSLCETLTLGAGLPRLPALQELQVESRAECLPADLWACQHLTRLDLDLKGAAALAVPAAHGAPCLPALQELRLARCRLPGGALPEAVCQLSGLRRLEVVKCGMASCCTSASAGLPPQFSRLCSLEHLSLESNSLFTLPPAVAALPALRQLDLSANMLSWLPPGPYLSTLETLILSANRLNQVPSVLAGASSLEVLDLSGNVGLELSRRDVQATLAPMPALSLLLLGKHATLGIPPPAAAAGSGWSTPSVAALVALGQALPQLDIDFEHTAAEYEGI